MLERQELASKIIKENEAYIQTFAFYHATSVESILFALQENEGFLAGTPISEIDQQQVLFGIPDPDFIMENCLANTVFLNNYEINVDQPNLLEKLIDLVHATHYAYGKSSTLFWGLKKIFGDKAILEDLPDLVDEFLKDMMQTDQTLRVQQLELWLGGTIHISSGEVDGILEEVNRLMLRKGVVIAVSRQNPLMQLLRFVEANNYDYALIPEDPRKGIRLTRFDAIICLSEEDRAVLSRALMYL